MRIPRLHVLLLTSVISAQNGSIGGIVTDGESAEPLIGANVIVSGPAIPEITGSATDAVGRYRISNLPSGEYTVNVTFIGYKKEVKTVTLAVDQDLTLNFALTPKAIELETYVVTASRRRERIEDAPAAISVITSSDIRRESNTNLGDYLKSVKGVEFTQSGIDSYNLSARGFNQSFSSRFLTLTDGRMANVPSLRLIAYNVIPVSFEDVQQIEVVLGPSSALYGPNAHSGVLNIVTMSPLESQGTSVNIQRGFLSQSNTDPLQKYTLRHASKFRDFGFKISAVALRGQDWQHFNEDEYEGHDPAFLGRPSLIHDRIDIGGIRGELGSPVFTEDMMTGEIPGNGIDDNGNGFIDEDERWIGMRFADGMDNQFPDGEDESPVITQDMVDAAANDHYYRYVLDTGIVLWGVTEDMIGRKYADGLDNDHDGLIDEGIDTGIDDLAEKWHDGVDNDGDGEIDEDDEVGDKWLSRFGSYLEGSGLGNYKYDENGNIIFDTNNDGFYGGPEDFQINYGSLSRIIRDANDDDIDDYPDFRVQNYRYDIRADWRPNQDFGLSFTHGYAWARNINITGIARYIADGWVYRYYQSKLRYKSFFFQTYLNTSYSGDPSHPTRNLATGELIFDKSKKFSSQLQHTLEFLDGDFRFVWGMDYFLTLPDTRGTILSDNDGHDKRDNNGNGEAGSPILFTDINDNTWYDSGERFTRWAPIDTTVNGDPIDNAQGAITDGIDNDGDGQVDEGIDETAEDNRYTVNELGLYYQANWQLNKKWEFIQATRFDVHDRLTDLILFNNQQNRDFSPLNWELDFSRTDGLQISPKFGLVFEPKENQKFRLTWATAFNTPSNQTLFLDIFVTRAAIFKVYAKGAHGGYVYPRNEDGQPYWFNINTFDYVPMDTSRYIYFYPSVDPKIEGFYNHTTKDLPEIDAENISTWELGYKGRLTNSLYATLDLFTNHYTSFVSRPTFITPIVINKATLETDFNGNGVVNRIEDIVDNITADREDYDESFLHWRDNIEGVSAMDTIPGLAPPVVVGYLNYGEVDMSGLDASLTWFINRNLTFDLHYSYLNMTEFLNPVTNAKDPINAPRHKGGFKLRYTASKAPISMSLNYRYVDAFKWSSGVYFGNINAYSILDAHAAYELKDYLSAMLTISNILDHRHFEIIGGPKLGRMVVLRLQGRI